MTAEPPNTHASSSLSRLLQVPQTSNTLVLPPKPFTHITATSTANHGPNVSQSTAQQSLRTQQFQVLPTSLQHTVLHTQLTVPSISMRETSSTRQSSQTVAQRTTVNPQIPTQQPWPSQTHTTPSVHETSSNADDAISRLANVLSGGLQLRLPQSTEQQRLSTLMARQSQGNNLQLGQQVAQLGQTKVNLHNFSTWLSEVANALSFVIEPKQTPTASPLTGSALLAGNKTNFKKPFHQVGEIICVFCGKSGHYTDECKRYRTLEDRRQQLIKQHRCNVCLSKRYAKAHCTTSHLCVHCKKLVATTAAFVQ